MEFFLSLGDASIISCSDSSHFWGTVCRCSFLNVLFIWILVASISGRSRYSLSVIFHFQCAFLETWMAIWIAGVHILQGCFFLFLFGGFGVQAIAAVLPCFLAHYMSLCAAVAAPL